MYNINFKVKYKTIEDELLLKIQTNKNEKRVNEEVINEEYSSQDVLDICNKLYKDEIASVFYAEDIFDKKIEKSMELIFQKMIENNKFIHILEELKGTILDNNIITNNKTQNNANYLIFLTLFSYHLFYITHNCICQQLETQMIDNDLLVNLKQSCLLFLSNKE